MVLSEVTEIITICQAIYDRKGTIDENREDLQDLIDRMKKLGEDVKIKEIPDEFAAKKYKKLLQDVDIFVRKQNKNPIMRAVFAYGTKEKIMKYDRKLSTLDNDYGRLYWKIKNSSHIPASAITTAAPIEVPKPPVETSGKWSFFGRKKTENVSTPPKITQSRVEQPKSTSSSLDEPLVQSRIEPPKSASSSLHQPLVLSEQEKKAEKLALVSVEADDEDEEDTTCLEPTEKCIEITEGAGMLFIVLAQLTMACAAVC